MFAYVNKSLPFTRNDISVISTSMLTLEIVFVYRNGEVYYSREWPKCYPWVTEAESTFKAHFHVCKNILTLQKWVKVL